MVDEATAAAPVEAPASPTAAEPAEPTQTNGDMSTIPKKDEETAGKQATTEVTAPDGEGTTEVATAPSAAVDAAGADTTPASGKKEKRKSVGGGVPEHKNKKLNKKKSMPTLRLECKPGELYWARLKGYPPWPSVICDEQMLPESLLATRPVSTARPDGSIRDDFKEGGKNAKERTFPIMFLSTNEFTWMVNTNLTPLDPEECNALPNSKMTKALSNAWKIASEGHDLHYFKGILKVWQEEEAKFEKELREEEEREAKEAEERAAREAEEASKAVEEDTKPKKKSKSRKSKGGDDDVEMEDADAPKSAKKRKKDAESDGDGAKPKKTPKVTKLNAPKTPNGDASATKKSASKSKKKIVQAPKDEEEDEKPQMTEAEKLATREKAVLYLRHRLQKGFLSRDQAPQEAEMAAMADFFSQLEAYENLEPAIIRATKVHKVLKAIVKLSSIPKDEEFGFKKRSAAMLEIWNKRMEADGDVAPPSATEPKAPSLPAVEKAAEKAPQTNGEKPTEPAPAEAEPAKDDADPKEGAQEEIKEKAEEAADKLDEKVGAAADEKKKDEAEVPAAEPSEPVLKDVAMRDIVQDEESEAAKEATDAAAAAEAA